MRNLPPLPTLRTFEAAARRRSFKLAASELCVTPSSVSHQIRKLETWLGVQLFVRYNREVSLSPEGRLYLAYVTRALDALAEGTGKINRHDRAEPTRTRLIVGANSGFIDCWLSARLDDFSKRAPDLDLHLVYGEDIATFRHQDVDVAILHTTVDPKMPDTIILSREQEFVVCSPDFRVNGRPLTRAGDLSDLTLFHEIDIVSWQKWLAHFGEVGINALSGPVFQNSQAIFSRVEACKGVALGDIVVCGDHFLSGRLVKPLPQGRLSDLTTYLIPLRRDRSTKQIDLFCEWLVVELGRYRKKMKGMTGETTYPVNWPEQVT